MNRRDYPTLYLDTNSSKGTAWSKKGFGCKWTWETIEHDTRTQIQAKEQLEVRKDMDLNEHERLSKHYTSTQIQIKEQLVVRKDMDVNEQERLSNIRLRHKFK